MKKQPSTLQWETYRDIIIKHECMIRQAFLKAKTKPRSFRFLGLQVRASFPTQRAMEQYETGKKIFDACLVTKEDIKEKGKWYSSGVYVEEVITVLPETQEELDITLAEIQRKIDWLVEAIKNNWIKMLPIIESVISRTDKYCLTLWINGNHNKYLWAKSYQEIADFVQTENGITRFLYYSHLPGHMEKPVSENLRWATDPEIDLILAYGEMSLPKLLADKVRSEKEEEDLFNTLISELGIA